MRKILAAAAIVVASLANTAVAWAGPVMGC